jgi:hypothetical protein
MTSLSGFLFYASILSTLVIFNRSQKRISSTELILCATFLLLGMKALRMIAWWAIAMAPIVARQLASIQRDIPERRLLLRPVLQYLLVAGVTAVLVMPLISYVLPSKGAPHDEDPQSLVEFVESKGQLGNIFNTMEWGGILMWIGDLKVFIDGRIDPFPKKVFEDYMAISIASPNWEDLLSHYEINYIIASRQMNPKLVATAEKSPNWRAAYSDRVGVVFEKSNLAGKNN